MRLLLFLLCLIVLSPASAIADPQIVWTVQNRFRLFDSDAATLTAEQALLASIAKATTIEGAYLDVARDLRADHLGSPTQLYLRTHFQSRTSSRYDDGYVTPPAQIIFADLMNAGSGNPLCTWSVGGVVQATAIPCSKPVVLSVPFDSGYNADADVVAEIVGGVKYETHVHSRDRLILALGDSYAAGEGNPDRPADLRNVKAGIAGRAQDWWHPLVQPQGGVLPTRDSADWWSNECHRSLFSPQVLAGVRMAALDDRDSVTFLSFACAGAAVLDGLVAPQYSPPGENRIGSLGLPAIASHESQLDQAFYPLCRTGLDHTPLALPAGIPNWNHIYFGLAGRPAPQLPRCVLWNRKPDVILITVGGNDIGFAGLGAWGILPADPRALTALAVHMFVQQSWNHMSLVCPSVPFPLPPAPGPSDPRCLFPGDGNYGADELTQNELPHLLKVARDALATSGLAEHAVIIQAAYPAPFADQNGLPCGTLASVAYPGGEFRTADDLEGLWLAFRSELPRMLDFQLGVSASAASTLQADAYQPLIATLQNEARGTSWSVASPPPVYIDHGFCAGSGAYHRDFAFPQYIGLFNVSVWNPGFPRPSDWDAYAQRGRWIRNANDSVLTEMVSDPSGKVMDESLSGSLHPTAEGEAAVADSLYAALGATVTTPSPLAPTTLVAPPPPPPAPPPAPVAPAAAAPAQPAPAAQPPAPGTPAQPPAAAPAQPPQ
jgi:hypothetical protein